MFFDIVIVGGGLVGASLACALRDLPLKIALIDQKPAPHQTEIADNRALALSFSSIQCLKTLNLWSKIAEQAFPLQTVQVSKQGYWGVAEIDAKTEGLSALGAVVNAGFFNTILSDALQTIGNVHIFQPDEIIGWEKSLNTVEIELKSKNHCSTQLVVGADGVNSVVRRLEGIGIKNVEYAEIAIVGNVMATKSRPTMAFERFLGNGSIAMLPFGENGFKSVWILANSLRAEWLALSDAEYLERLQTVFGYRLGELSHLGKRDVYPLRAVSAEAIDGDRFVLIGNAANTLHPVAAQGFNLGLRDVAYLAETISLTMALKEEMGGIKMRRAYREHRRLDHQWIKTFTHQLATPSLLQWLGILGTESISVLKKQIVLGALGQNQPLPKLCRGVSLV